MVTLATNKMASMIVRPGLWTKMRANFQPEVVDYEDHDMAANFHGKKVIDEDIAYNGFSDQISNKIMANITITQIRQIEMPETQLTKFDYCKLFRQLSKKCRTNDVRSDLINKYYVGLCDNLKGFYESMEFDDCLITDIPAERREAVREYIIENLSIMILYTS